MDTRKLFEVWKLGTVGKEEVNVLVGSGMVDEAETASSSMPLLVRKGLM